MQKKIQNNNVINLINLGNKFHKETSPLSESEYLILNKISSYTGRSFKIRCSYHGNRNYYDIDIILLPDKNKILLFFENKEPERMQYTNENIIILIKRIRKIIKSL